MSQPDFQPTLTGPTVLIRPVVAADWAELFAAGSDPEIWKVHPRSNRYTEPEFRSYFDSAVASKMAFVFVERATGRLIAQAAIMATSPNAARSRSAGRLSFASFGAVRPTAKSSG
jgi:RimJ/RimL family protein N-acetyltransferase